MRTLTRKTLHPNRFGIEPAARGQPAVKRCGTALAGRYSRTLGPTAFALSLFVLAIAADPWTAALQYNRELVLQGQWWRLLTGGFVHLGALHAGVNAAAAGFLLMLALRFALGCELVRNLLLGAPLLNIVLLVCSPAVEFAAGLSGALHAAATALGLRLLLSGHSGLDTQSRRLARGMGAALLFLIGLKLLAERAWQTPVVFESWWAFPVVVAAHLAGAAVGVLLAAWPWGGAKRAFCRLMRSGAGAALNARSE